MASQAPVAVNMASQALVAVNMTSQALVAVNMASQALVLFCGCKLKPAVAFILTFEYVLSVFILRQNLQHGSGGRGIDDFPRVFRYEGPPRALPILADGTVPCLNWSFCL